ncbi:MAG TPA: hypothetical protein VEC14_07350 [Reyranellaceae bacterium]|nr:hypothetical protein [Reyranellaceae bacterium]
MTMQFPALTKAWIQLIALVLSTGTAAGVTAFLGGAHWGIALIVGLGTAGSNVYHALSESPRDKGRTTPPFAGKQK